MHVLSRKNVCYLHTQSFCGHYRGQPVHAGTASNVLEDFVEANSTTPSMQLLMATSAFRLGRRCYTCAQQFYLHRLCTVKMFMFTTNGLQSLQKITFGFRNDLLMLHNTRWHSAACPLYQDVIHWQAGT